MSERKWKELAFCRGNTLQMIVDEINNTQNLLRIAEILSENGWNNNLWVSNKEISNGKI